MPNKYCPGCAAILVQEPRVVGGVPMMFWVCPEGDWEEPVDTASQSENELKEAAEK